MTLPTLLYLLNSYENTNLTLKSKPPQNNMLKQASGIHLFHQPEKIIIATKENMKSHFNVVSTSIHKRANFSTNERS